MYNSWKKCCHGISFVRFACPRGNLLSRARNNFSPDCEVQLAVLPSETGGCLKSRTCVPLKFQCLWEQGWRTGLMLVFNVWKWDMEIRDRNVVWKWGYGCVYCIMHHKLCTILVPRLPRMQNIQTEQIRLFNTRQSTYQCWSQWPHSGVALRTVCFNR